VSRRGRAVALVVVLGVVALVVGALVVGVPRTSTSTTDATPAAASHTTATVVRTDLVVTEDMDGTLGFVAGDPIVNRLPGTLTAIPDEGATYTFGDVLYRVDDTPVVLAEGSLPMWRTLSTRSSNGRDVEQLERMLVASGYDPDGKITVDEDFTTATRNAVKDWQTDLGMDDTGIVELGRIVFRSAPVRIVEVPSPVGTALRGGEVLATTSGAATKVTARLDTADQEHLAVGDAVTVELPDSTKVPATVTSIGSVAQRAQDGSSYLEVEIALDDPATGEGLDEAPVTVTYEKERAEQVLAVPVTALVALAEGGYAVEVVDPAGTHLVGVDAGTFADGLVEVTGNLQAGDEVVVP